MPPLEEGEVQIWRVDLSKPVGRGLLAPAYGVLSGSERTRAARMRLGKSREEFVAGRGCLRRLLGIGPGVALEEGANGKPELEGFSFNVAHSRGLILIALTRSGSIGVDVEYMDEGIEAFEVAETSFHPADLKRIEEARSEAERIWQFYRCWTRKEAIAKADGRGLTMPAVEVSMGAGGEEIAVEGWFVRELVVDLQHMAALASSEPGLRVRMFELTTDCFWSGLRIQVAAVEESVTDLGETEKRVTG